VDETATKIGRDFYEVFFSAWEAPPGVLSYNIRIQEMPSLGLGSQVIVHLDGEPLFQLQLQPRYDIVEDLAQRAAVYTRQELERRQPDPNSSAAGDRRGGG
jgi:curli production assembly/transport component CsgE